MTVTRGRHHEALVLPERLVNHARAIPGVSRAVTSWRLTQAMGAWIWS